MPLPRIYSGSIWGTRFLRAFLAELGIDENGAAFAAARARFMKKAADLEDNLPISSFVLREKAPGSRTVTRISLSLPFLDSCRASDLAAQLAFRPDLTDLLIRGRHSPELDLALDEAGIRLFPFGDQGIRFQPAVSEETAAYAALSLAEAFAAGRPPMTSVLKRWGPEALAHAAPEESLLMPSLLAAARHAAERLGVIPETPDGRLQALAHFKPSLPPSPPYWIGTYRTVFDRPPASEAPEPDVPEAPAILSPFGSLFDELATSRRNTASDTVADSADGRDFLYRFAERIQRWTAQQKRLAAAPQIPADNWLHALFGLPNQSGEIGLCIGLDPNDAFASYAMLACGGPACETLLAAAPAVERAAERFERPLPGVVRALSVLSKLPSMPLCLLETASEPLLLWRAASVCACELLTAGDMMPIPAAGLRGRPPRMVWMPVPRTEKALELIRRFASLAAPSQKTLRMPFLTKDDPALRAVLCLMLAGTAAAYGASERGLFTRGKDVLLSLLTPRPVAEEDACRAGRQLADYAQGALAHFMLKGRPALTLAEGPDDTLILRRGWLPPEGKEAQDVLPLDTAPLSERQALDALFALIRHEARLYPGLCASSGGFRVEGMLFARFIDSTVTALRSLGFFVTVPESLVESLHPDIDLTVVEGGTGSGADLLGCADQAEFRFEVSMGGVRLSEKDIDTLLGHSGIFRMGRRRVYVSEGDQARLRAARSSGGVPAFRLSAWDKLRAVLSGRFQGYRVRPSAALRAHLDDILKTRALPMPAGLHADLRPYQQRGIEWMIRNLRLGLGSLIADDMGLGKTLQVIAVIQHLRNEGELNGRPVLVAAPASILINWQREIMRFAPGLRTLLYHGTKRRLSFSTDVDVVLTSYALLRIDRRMLSSVAWRLLVLDEAQAVKNCMTGQSHAVRVLNAQQVIAMTGTPVENRLSEYWSIMNAVEPGLLGEQAEFSREFAEPISEGGTEASEALARFRALTAPFILRRMKTDRSIIADLPDKNVGIRFVQLNALQRTLYRSCLGESIAGIRTLRELEASGDAELARRAHRDRRMHILAMITYMKQIANSPSQYLKTESAEPDSGKGEALMELLEESFGAGSKVLVFTQYREMGDRLVRWIEGAGFGPCLYYHGELGIRDRMEAVDSFQNDPACRVMVLTLRAGGTGLNLTAASVVIHYDLWWNPAVENQATDRAYRIGQTKDVMVYRFVTAGTFEERINAMLEAKQHLADAAVVSGEKWLGDLSDSELEDLFSLKD